MTCSGSSGTGIPHLNDGPADAQIPRARSSRRRPPRSCAISGVMKSGLVRRTTRAAVFECRQLEEVALLAHALHCAAAFRASAIDELCLGNEGLVDGAVPAFVRVFVEKAALLDPPPDRLSRAVMPWLGGSDEVVVRNVQVLEQATERSGNFIRERLRRHAPGVRRPLPLSGRARRSP